MFKVKKILLEKLKLLFFILVKILKVKKKEKFHKKKEKFHKKNSNVKIIKKIKKSKNQFNVIFILNVQINQHRQIII